MNFNSILDLAEHELEEVIDSIVKKVDANTDSAADISMAGAVKMIILIVEEVLKRVI
jgi:hypothetical protein